MNTVHIRATSIHAPAAKELGDYWQNHHHSLLDIQFKRVGLLGTLDWVKGVAMITAQLPTDQSTPEERLLALANMAVVGAQYAALQIAEGSITTALSAWPAGGAVGVLAGSQVARDVHPLARLVVMVGVGALGALVTSQIRAEIPIYRLTARTDGSLAWERTPFGVGTPFQPALT
jgi:hypothetical protein